MRTTKRSQLKTIATNLTNIYSMRGYSLVIGRNRVTISNNIMRVSKRVVVN